MSRRDQFDAIVVGGGPVALASALGLARAGLQAALTLDHEPASFNPHSAIDLRVYALAPDVCAWLKQLGVWQFVEEQRHCEFQSMQVWDASSSGSLRFTAAEYGWPALGTIVEHGLLCSALWQAVQACETISVVHGLVEKTERVDSLTVASVSDRTLRGRLLVAADGADSQLRKHLGIATYQLDYRQSALVTTLSSELPHQHCAWQRFLPDGPIAMLPLANGQCSMVWTLPTARADVQAALSDEACLAEIQRAFGDVLGRFTQIGARRTAPLQLRLAHEYVRDNVVLVGDAAHLVHPLAGQGLNLGLRDSQCLARELGKTQSLNSALRRYERERKSENELAARGIDALQRVFTPARGPLAWSRGLGMTALHSLAPIKRLFAELATGNRAGL